MKFKPKYDGYFMSMTPIDIENTINYTKTTNFVYLRDISETSNWETCLASMGTNIVSTMGDGADMNFKVNRPLPTPLDSKVF